MRHRPRRLSSPLKTLTGVAVAKRPSMMKPVTYLDTRISGQMILGLAKVLWMRTGTTSAVVGLMIMDPVIILSLKNSTQMEMLCPEQRRGSIPIPSPIHKIIQ